MVARIDTGDGLTELAASGFANLVRRESRRRPDRVGEALRAHPDVSLVHAADGVAAYHIEAPRETHSDTGLLVPSPHLQPDRPPHTWTLTISNGAGAPWVLPTPIQPTVGRLRWRPAAGGAVTDWREVRILLPLALAPGSADSIAANLGGPPGGCDCDPELEFPELGWHLTGTRPARP